MRLIVPMLAALLLASCMSVGTPEADFRLKRIRMPNGSVVFAEVAMTKEEMIRGMMFRNKVEKDRGMFFVHAQTGLYPYWMFQVKIPLDIIWLDRNKRIVEIAANAQPCMVADSRQCPMYGGNRPSQFVLELAGGDAAKRNLQVGDQLDW